MVHATATRRILFAAALFICSLSSSAFEPFNFPLWPEPIVDTEMATFSHGGLDVKGGGVDNTFVGFSYLYGLVTTGSRNWLYHACAPTGEGRYYYRRVTHVTYQFAPSLNRYSDTGWFRDVRVGGLYSHYMLVKYPGSQEVKDWLAFVLAPCVAQPLTANAQLTGPQLAAASTNCTAAITLDGSLTSGTTPRTYQWLGAGGQIATGIQATVQLGIGAHRIILRVTAGGHTDDDTVDVVVSDNAPPVFTSIAAPQTVECSGHEGTAFTPPRPTATDCGAFTITSNAPAVFPLGATIVTFTAVDDAGNASITTTAVTVQDTMPPLLSNVPPPVTVDEICEGAVVTIQVPTAFDVCDGAVAVTFDAGDVRILEVNAFSFVAVFYVGQTTVTFTAVDAHGNVAVATTIVTVNPAPPPHVSGDFSVDAAGKDITPQNPGIWTATKYYSTVDSANPGGNPLEAMLAGPSTFSVNITRFIQAIAQKTIDNGVVSATAHLRICAVLKENTPDVTFTINGVGADSSGSALSMVATYPDVGSIYEFDLSTLDLKFPLGKGVNGAAPVPAPNTLVFNGNSYEIHWIELSFDAMSPYILIHGKGADGGFWDADPAGKTGVTAWPPFTATLRSREIPFDNSIDLVGTLTVPSQDTVTNQATDLNNQITRIVNTFGTSHLNLIVHSKGGLDSRYWLTEFNRNPLTNGPNFIIGQFITICTPHRGSAIADLAVLSYSINRKDIEANVAVGSVPSDQAGALVAFQVATTIDKSADTPATYCLRTNPTTPDRRPLVALDDCQTFNATFGVKLAGYRNQDGTWVSYFAIKADADRNFDFQITVKPDLLEVIRYDPSSIATAPIAYSTLGRIKSWSQPPGFTFPYKPFPFISTYNANLINVISYPLGSFQPNDFLVTFDSAIYPPFADFLQPPPHYDHGGIARDFIATQISVRNNVMVPRK